MSESVFCFVFITGHAYLSKCLTLHHFSNQLSNPYIAMHGVEFEDKGVND